MAYYQNVSWDVMEGLRSNCYSPNCEEPPTYSLGWYGLNQHGENPILICQRSVCDNIGHMAYVGKHESFGGVPDEIVDLYFDKECPELLEKVILKMIGGEQLEFPFMKLK